MLFLISYRSAITSLAPSAAKMTANERCIQRITLGEFTTYLRTPFADKPYKMKMNNVIPINIMLRVSNKNIGDVVSGETKSGKKAKKNIESLGLRILIKKPFIAIRHKLFLVEGELNFIEPVSRHIDHDR